MFKNKRIRYVGYEEMQDLLTYARKNYAIILGEPQIPLGWYAYVEDTMCYVRLTMKKEVACTYIFRKDLVEETQKTTGLNAYINLCGAFKKATGYSIPVYEDAYGTACPILTYKAKYNKQRVHAYAYDQNSSYAWAMKEPMPDTREIIGRDRCPKDGELGFIELSTQQTKGWLTADGIYLKMVTPEDGYNGKRADYIFPMMNSPFVDFADRWYDVKKNSKDPAEKAKAKQMLVFSVGYLQRKNPFLRCAVIEWANRHIWNLTDKNSIYVNTDCIVSTAERPDLPIGGELGEFKIEHTGDFAHIGFNYQWDMDTPSYRGIPKSWFKNDWDMLKDDVPANGNIYELNRITMRLEVNNYEIQNAVYEKLQ
ncbi:MAG: hypothetical protein KBS62_03430 [Oscillospiraceae bacterium]|nr:hypothetical protein [Candidatus Ruminococcus equi]